MDDVFMLKLAQIQSLLAEAYEHYFKYSDGHCKSSEGAISIHFPSFFWNEDGMHEQPSIEVYSYVLGPHRSHYFKTIDEALATVQEWHRDEMSFDHEASEAEMEAAMVSWAESNG